MPFSQRSQDTLAVGMAALLAGLVFLVDVAEPLGSALGMAYVPIILIGLWVRWATYPLWAAAAATLLSVGLVAALIPALRASRIDPAIVLREQ